MKKLSFLLLGFCLIENSAWPQTAVKSWATDYYTPLHGYDYGNRIVVDSSGNLIVAGRSDHGNLYQTLILKVSSAGTPVWTNYFEGLTPIALGCDTNNNLYLAGTGRNLLPGALQVSSSGVLLASNLLTKRAAFGKYANDNLYTYCKDDATVVKHTALGIPMWTNAAGNMNSSVSMVTDSADNMFVAGFSTTSLRVLAYSSNGIPLWTNTFTGLYPGGRFSPGQAYDSAIAMDANTNLFVSAYGNSSNLITLKFSKSGSLIWSNEFRSPALTQINPQAVAVDQASGNVYVSGGANSRAFTIGYNNSGTPLWTNFFNAGWASLQYYDVWGLGVRSDGSVVVCGNYLPVYQGKSVLSILAYSSGGTLLWTNQWGGATADSYAQAMQISGNTVYVTGYDSQEDVGFRADCLTLAYNNSGALLWSNVFDSVAIGADFIKAMAVDRNGKVYTAGSSYNETNLDSQLIAYENSGAVVWSNRFDSPGPLITTPPAAVGDQLVAVVAAPNGRVYAAGTARGGDSRSKVLTLCYSTNGAGLWTNLFSGNLADSDNQGTSLAVDSVGNVFVGGYFGHSSSAYDYGVLAFSSDGVPLWTNRFNGPGNGSDKIAALCLDKDDNLIVTGTSGGAGSGSDYLTIKFSNGGVPLWTNRYNGPANSTDQGTGVAVDGAGNVFVSGISLSASTQDYAVIAYSPSGLPLWTNRCHPSVYFLVGSVAAVRCDKAGNVYMAGCVSSGSATNDVIIKYNNAGLPLWTNVFASSLFPQGVIYGIAVDDLGTCYATGTAVASDSLSTDTYTVAYSPSGSELWAMRESSPLAFNRDSWGASIALSPDGDVFVGANRNANVPPGVLSLDGYYHSLIKYSSKPLIVASPASLNLLSGSGLNLSAGASGTQPFAYQWYFQGAPLNGATNSTLVISNSSPAQQGSYLVVITNAFGSSTSAPALVNVFTNVSSSIQVSALTRSNITLSASGITGLSYALGVSTNLKDWTALVTNPSPYSFVDTNRPLFNQRFYRLQWAP